jgi:uncharacterized protein YndB with AHSA1/START domain
MKVVMNNFSYETIISTKAEVVWKAITNPDITQKFWFGIRVESEWNIGGTIKLYTPEGLEAMEGKVLEFDLFKKLSFSWLRKGEDEVNRVKVVFEFLEMGPLTKVTVFHDIDVNNPFYQYTVSGWVLILCSLKTLIETSRSMPGCDIKRSKDYV